MIPTESGPIFVEATHWRPRLTPPAQEGAE
jgi:hypothetical protein